MKSADDFWAVAFKLLHQGAGDAVGDFEFAFIFFDQLEKQAICGEITFVSNFSANLRVFLVVKIFICLVKNGVMS
jgi:hypothetical protein